ncbi:hypothetical protein [Paenibacillus donghaensis]|uniref:hypothetical protein n=1 Tax=Paenibacillus donghaensis TaxID=414771 RepID=UPI0031840C09
MRNGEWEVSGRAQLPEHEKYTLVSVIEGKGYLRIQTSEYPLVKGDHLILPVDFGPYELAGELVLIISRE